MAIQPPATEPAAAKSAGTKVVVEKKTAVASERGTPSGVTKGPEDVPQLLGLARTFFDAKDFAAAEAAASAASVLDETSTAAWTMLAVCRVRLNRHDGAAQAFLKALALDPKAAAVWVDLGELYLGRGRYELAAEALRNACELDKDGSTGPGRRARALIGRTLALLKRA